MKKTLLGKWAAATAGGLLAALIFLSTPITGLAYTQAVGIVSADAANVRKEPTTGSESITGLTKGSTVTITDEVTDSAGSVWYKVTVDGSTGYIRSDLMIKGAGSSGNTTTTTSETKPAPTEATPIAETKAYINYESARIRQGASTNHDIVGSATKNTPVTITAEAKASDGKRWYQIKYTSSGGSEIVGFIRSDLVTIGDPPAAAEPPAETPDETVEAEVPTEPEGEEGTAEGETPEVLPEEGEAPTEPEVLPEEETKPDYEMVYRQNDNGEMEWYLYDNIKGTMQTLNNLMAAAEAGVRLSAEEGKQLSTERIIIIVLAVVAAALAVTVTLLLFKIRDLYDEDYEDDDDDDDEEDEDEDDEEDEEDDEEEEPVVRRRKKAKTASVTAVRTSSARRRKAAEEEEEDEEDEEEEEEQRPVKASRGPARKPKNFLVDDDEFEFEFLNMDDRD